LDFEVGLRSRAKEYHAQKNYRPDEDQEQQAANDLIT
jgi:hypothetical protein